MKKIFIYLILILFSLSFVNATLNDALAYYSFDNDSVSGATVIDVSGNNKNGTKTDSTSPAQTPNGKLGEGIYFNGTSNDIVNMNGVYIPATSEWMVNTWINLTNSAAGSLMFLSQYDVASAGRLICRYLPSSNQISCNWEGGSSSGSVSVSINQSWRMVTVGVKDGFFIGYENGVLLWNVSRTGSIYQGDTTQISSDSGWTSEGIIDEFSFYNRSLTYNEILELYNNGSGLNPYDNSTPIINSNLTSYYNTSNINISLTSTQAVNMSYFFNGNDSNLENNLVLYYQAEDNTTSKTGINNGTNNGATYTTWMNGYGKSFNFDGSSYVSASNFGIDGDVTQCAWIYPTTVAGDQGIVSKVYGSTSGSRNGKIGISSGYIQYYLRNTTGGSVTISSTDPITANQAYHVCAVTNGLTGSLYINGVLNETGTVIGNLDTGVSDFEVGAKDSGSGTPEYFNGYIDEVKVFNVSLNSSQISSVYTKSPYTVIADDTSSSSLYLSSLTDGDYNITFVSANNYGVSYNAESFSVDTSAPSINNNILTEYNSYTIDGFNSSCSDINLQSCNLSLNSQNVLLNVSSFTFTQNGNVSYNITAIDTFGNVMIESGTILVNPYQYFRFHDGLDYVSNYSLNGYNFSGVYANLTPYNNGLVLGNNNILFSKIGYNSLNISFNINTTSALNETYNITNANIVIYVYDRNNLSLITDTVSLSLVGTYGYNATTTTGIFNITEINLFDESYIAILESDNYATETLYFDFDNKQQLTVNAYLLSLNNSNFGTINIRAVANTGELINGAICSALEWIPSQSSYITVAQGLTNTNGETILNIELGSKLYKFSCSKSGVVSTTNSQIISIDDSTLTVTMDINPTTPTLDLDGVSWSLVNTTYNSTHDLITFTVNDNSGLSNTACIYIYKTIGTALTQLNKTCSSSNSLILYDTVKTNNTYKVVVLGTINSIEVDEIIYPETNNIAGQLSLYNFDLLIPLVLFLLGLGLGLILTPNNIYISIIASGIGVWFGYIITPSIISLSIAVGCSIILGLMFWGGYRNK